MEKFKGKKYIISFVVLAVATLMNWMKIEIQDNWVQVVLIVVGAMTTGFTAKEIVKVIKK